MNRNRHPVLRLATILAAALIFVSVVYRFIWLDHIPGLNADETYPLVQLMLALDGRPHMVQSPHGQFFNPIMMAAELLTLLARQPSVFLLRLPAAIVGCLTLACFAYAGRRVLPTARQALFATLFLGAMPMSIAFSRIHWDASYLPLLECFVLFPMLELADGRRTRWTFPAIALVTFLGLWTHATFAMLMVSLTAMVLIMRRREVLAAVAGRLHVKPGPALAVALVVAPAVIAAALFFGLTVATDHSIATIYAISAQPVWTLLSSPAHLFHYYWRIGDNITGVSVYEDVAGMPIYIGLHLFSLLALLLLAAGVVVLSRSPRATDRALAVFWLMTPLVLIPTAGILTLDLAGVERYAVWLLPPAAVTFARFGARLLESRGRGDLSCALLLVPLSAIFLVQFYANFLDPLSRLESRAAGRIYWTADIDPKFAAADWIRRNANHADVYAQDWWSDYPLQYALGLDWNVVTNPDPVELPRRSAVFVYFADPDPVYPNDIARRLKDAHRRIEIVPIPGADRHPVIFIIYAPIP